MSSKPISLLLIANQADLQILENSVGNFGECERLDIATVKFPSSSKKTSIAIKTLLIPFFLALIFGLGFLLRLPAWTSCLIAGVYFGWAVFGNVYAENSLRNRVLRFYNCQNHLLWSYNRIFSRKSIIRVVLVSERSVPQNKWGVFGDLLDYLQGVPSMTVLITSLKSHSIEATAFDAGFDYVIESEQMNEIPSLAVRHFYLVGRNRVTMLSLTTGILFGIVGSFCLGVTSQLGAYGGEKLWQFLIETFKYWTSA